MRHPVSGRVRLASHLARLFYRAFGPENPRGWADYHIVAEEQGTFWIHSHGLAPRVGADLEFVGVPPDLRDDALRLLLALAATGDGRSGLQDGADFAAELSSPRQDFLEICSLRASARKDTAHRGIVRVVDFGRSSNSGFPRRLFAAHFTARADYAESPSEKLALLRTALKLFPGDFAGMTEGAGFEPGRSSLTALQNKTNLVAYLGLAQALRDQGRFNEACGYLAEAIARCPGWAQAYRPWVLDSYSNNDAWFRYWRDVDIAGTAIRRRMAAAAGTPARVTLRAASASGTADFGAGPGRPPRELRQRG